jgi:hypothetical protein
MPVVIKGSQPESTDLVFLRQIVDGGWVRRECGSPVVMVWTLSAAAWCSAAVVAMDFLGDRR